MIVHSSPISGVDVHLDGLVATAGYDNAVILWDANGVPLTRANHDHLVNQCRFSPDGTQLVTASSDYSARIWSIPALRLIAVLRGHDDDVEMASFSPDGARVATASRDHTIGVFSNDGTLIARLRGHRADVISVEWSADGCELVSSSDDGTVRRWCATTYQLRATIDLGGVEADTVVHLPDGTIFAGTDDGDIAVIGESSITRIRAHASGIKRLIANPATRTLTSAGYDRAIRIWSIEHGGTLVARAQTIAPPAVWLRSMAWRGEDQLICGTFGSGFAVYHRESDRWDLSRVSDTAGVNAVCRFDGGTYTVGDAGIVARDGVPVQAMGSLCNFLVPFGTRLLTGGHLGTVLDAASGTLLYRHWSPLNCGTIFVRDGVRHCAIGSYTGEVIIFRDKGTGDVEWVATVPVHSNAVKGLAANASDILSVCATGEAAATPITTLGPARTIGHSHDRISNGVAALSDGGFASIGRDRMLRFWNDGMSKCVATPHEHSIKCLAVCPDTGAVATGSYVGVVAIYDPAIGVWAGTERPTMSGISSLAPLGEGRFLAASYDGQVYEIPATTNVSVKDKIDLMNTFRIRQDMAGAELTLPEIS